jgi:glycosyltransferase involved in cell wall biosynthesis
MKKLREKFRNINAVMLGGGPMMEKMQEVITAEKLDDTITLCGKQTRQEVFAYMRRSKILLHTSEYEGQCLVFAEALAHGMYVVSRHVGRVEDSDKHVIGWNEEELFLHCEKLLQCKMHFEPYQSLNTNEIVQQYIELYNS